MRLARNLKILVELPIRRTDTNADVTAKLQSFDNEMIKAFVFSDKAGGLDHYCEAEDILCRNTVRDLLSRKAGSNVEIWNVLRTGDRCTSKLLKTGNGLVNQGASRLLLVSGHDYRTKLAERAARGEKCNKDCDFRLNPSVLCGMSSSEVFNKQILSSLNVPLGCVLQEPFENSKLGTAASFYITQACPMYDLDAWLSRHISIAKSSAKELYVTVIPILSLRELDRVAGLGGQVPEKVYQMFRMPKTDQIGLNLAKDTVSTLSRVPEIDGIYLYHHRPSVIKDLLVHLRADTGG